MSVHVQLILFTCLASYVASFHGQGIYENIKNDNVVEQEAVISNVAFKIKPKYSKVSSPLQFTNQQKPKGDRYEIYKPNWDDLDKRPLPKWYDEAKIGIFVHWGVFSVPSFRSEWFWWDWQGAKYNNTVEYMKKNYRPGFTYADFAPKFTAEFFNADQWADIFNTSGARYVVFTSKHHEGYTNWPSNYSFNWNSMAVGPKRDIVGELSTALRKRNLHVGMYHSLFEWFHPLYLQDKENKFRTQQFVKSKTLPELYELVNTYKPDVVWSDGDWEALDTYWNSTEFIAWLYNYSPVKDTVVTNDRWGSGVMCKHGGYFTCMDRYNPGKLQTRKWENAMTIDSQSWGYRRNANLSDYLSIEQLIETIVETISCGGNILVNVGPSHDGVIKPIFKERLSQMGEWLKVNGEAIYSSVPWKFQNDTVTPKVWYTAHITDTVKTVYAILLRWPEKDTLFLGAPTPSKDTTVQMLGSDISFQWTKGASSGMLIQIPLIPHNQMPCKWAWTFKVSNLLNS